MTDYKVFVYDDPDDSPAPDGETPDSYFYTPKKTIDLEHLTAEEDRALLKAWFPADDADSFSETKAILSGVRDVNFWVGLGKRPTEVLQRWAGGQPWLPIKLSIKQNLGGKDQFLNFSETDALPLTAETIRREVQALNRQLPNFSASTGRLPLFDARPAWRLAERTETNFENVKDDLQKKHVKLDGYCAYRFELCEAVRFKAFFEALKDRFRLVAPGLDTNNFSPEASYTGLCGAWYVVEVHAQDAVFLNENGTKTNQFTVRVPVGLISALKADDPTPVLVFFVEKDKTKVYTPGLDFRFVAFPQVVNSEQFLSNVQWLKKSFLKRVEFKSQKKFLENLDIETVKRPLVRFKLLGNSTWRTGQEDERIATERKWAPAIIGKEPLAVFNKDGIHLLENEKQIGAWSAKNELLKKLWQPPPWDNISTWLDEPISRVYNGTQLSLPKAPTRISPVLWPGGREALEDEVDQLGDARDCSNHLIAALLSRRNGVEDDNAGWNKKMAVTIRRFREMKKKERFDYINDLWNILTTAYDFDVCLSNMYEPSSMDDVNIAANPNNLTGIIKEERPLPTAWRPDGFREKGQRYITYYDGLRDNPATAGLWKKYGVGFRVDGEWPLKASTQQRLEANGMTQWRLNTELMAERSGFYIKGTQLETEIDKARFWNYNYDILNQTAVCVARNFFGATAFPERWTDGCYPIFAVDCSDLRGCDTERVQLELFRKYRKKKWWRPGEKAYQAIPWDHIIGWVPITRQGQPDGTGWKFTIGGDQWLINEDWKKSRGYSDDKLRYIKAELDAWRGTCTVPANYDFMDKS